MNDTWHSGDIDAAKAELLAAGWIQQDATTWKAPDGSRHRGPAGAWRTMKRAQNDARSSAWRGEPSRAFLDEQAQATNATDQELRADHSAAIEFVREIAAMPCTYECGNCLSCRARRWLHTETTVVRSGAATGRAPSASPRGLRRTKHVDGGSA